MSRAAAASALSAGLVMTAGLGRAQAQAPSVPPVVPASVGQFAPERRLSIGLSAESAQAPLLLARQKGLFERRGIQVEFARVPVSAAHLALAAGDIDCAAAPPETWITWQARGLKLVQVLLLDRNQGASGIVSRASIGAVTDLRGRSVATPAPGTPGFFLMSWILGKHDAALRDVKRVTMDAAQAMPALRADRGGIDAFVADEPDLSLAAVQGVDNVVSGQPAVPIHVLASTRDYPFATIVLGCDATVVSGRSAALTELVNGWFEALSMIEADGRDSNRVMAVAGQRDVDGFAAIRRGWRWQDRTANQRFFSGEYRDFSREAASLLSESGLINRLPDLGSGIDARFIR